MYLFNVNQCIPVLHRTQSIVKRNKRTMDFIPENEIFKFNPDTLRVIRQDINMDKPGDMMKAVDLLEEWVKQQRHFKRNTFPRHYLESTIITAKGSLEKAKSRLDKLCTFKTLMPNLFPEHNINHLPDISHFVSHAHLPKSTKEGHRIYLSKILSTDFDSNDLLNYHRAVLLISEYVKMHDYSNGFYIICDCSDINVLKYITKVNPMDLRQFLTVLVEGFGLRIKGILLLTPSKAVDTLMSFVKQVVSAKIGDRISIHKTIESLHEIVPKGILPEEYGGSEMSTAKLANKWRSVLSTENNLKDLEQLYQSSTDEAYRLQDTFNESYLGMPGSFRTLSVD